MHTHPESNGGHNHQVLFSHELVLQLGLGSSVHSSMKRSRLEPFSSKFGSKLFSLLLQCDIYDGRSFVVLQEFEKRRVQFLLRHPRFSKQLEVRAIRICAEESHGLVDVKSFADIPSNSWSCSRCETYYSFSMYFLGKSSYFCRRLARFVSE